jgi:hypothetical protein
MKLRVFFNDLRKTFEMNDPFRGNYAKLGKVAPKGIRQLGLLTNKHITCFKDHAGSLLIFPFTATSRIVGRDAASATASLRHPPHHSFAASRMAHINWREQFYLMAEFANLTPPEMGARTSFHCNSAGRHFGKEPQNR